MNPLLANALEGRYAVDREIGRGGMATVYLARDVRHNRKVALKVLNPELGAVLGVERFLAEIEVTANLQHPNLLPLFDSGEVNGQLFYVMPFVEGETLRARLEREKQLPVDEAVRIASAIAGALDYAHRHHVIHRDLKPENVLMHEGQPLIADFGIALAVSNAGGSRITQTGLSLGTPQYMSPEQATGDRVIDGRTDIYSLGAITYEMLVGDPPHAASTAQAIIAKVLTETPQRVRVARPSAPEYVDRAVARALEKLPADRFSSAKEFADAIEGRAGAAPAKSTSARVAVNESTPAGASTRASRGREIAAWSLAAFLAIAFAWRQFAPAASHDEMPVIRAPFDLPPNMHMYDAIAGTTIAVSPKGDMIAFGTYGAASYRMYLRRVSELAPRELVDAAGRNITFSPDGRWIAYTEGNVIKKVSVDGGQPVQLASTGSAVPYGVSWSPTDTLYIGSFSGMWQVAATGGTATPVGGTSPSAQQIGRRWPLVLPGAKAIAYVSGNSSVSASRLAVLTLASGKTTDFEVPIGVPLGVIDDQFVYVSTTGGLMALRFDVAANKPVGEPVQLDDGVVFDATQGAKASLSTSGSGTLAYLRGRSQLQPVMVTLGSAAPTPLFQDAGAYSTPRFSPDGKRIAMTVFSQHEPEIWIYDIARNTFTPLTSEGVNIRPEWTADGKDLVFVSTRANKTAIWRQVADGTGPPELLYQPEFEPFEAILSADRKWLVYRTAPGGEHSRDILAVSLADPKNVVPIAVGPTTTESMPELSPDQHWIVYQSNETGRFEIYVRPFPGTGARVPVSDNGGTEPRWDRSGHALYYRGPNGELIEVAVATEPHLSLGARKLVLTGEFTTDASHANYDVGPDGRFVMLRRTGAEAQPIVVHNWGRELREKTASRK
jgi:eukaryotic-like serine/threonine-protein kinase